MSEIWQIFSLNRLQIFGTQRTCGLLMLLNDFKCLQMFNKHKYSITPNKQSHYNIILLEDA